MGDRDHHAAGGSRTGCAPTRRGVRKRLLLSSPRTFAKRQRKAEPIYAGSALGVTPA